MKDIGVPPTRKSNDQDISVQVWMKMSDRDEIADRPIGTRFNLGGLRVGQRGGDLRIATVKGATGDNEDWDD